MTPAADSILSMGLRVLSSRDTAQALQHLRQAFKADPTQTINGGPPAGYWLGRVLHAQGKRRAALQRWKKSLNAYGDSTMCDIVLSDVILRTLENREISSEWSVAGRAYRSVLGQAGTLSSPLADSIAARHVAQLSPLFSGDSLNISRKDEKQGVDSESRFQTGIGEQLLRWWRDQDPLPATERNERMIEHLRRVDYARREFGCEKRGCRPQGWDERGTVYVRFGPPAQRESVTYNEADFNLDVFRSGVPVSSHDFPDNELWTYDHIDQSGKYVFVEEDGVFRVGRTNDLLPRSLRTGLAGRTDRSLNKAVSSLAALRHIYEKLALYHGDYTQRYAEVQDYFSWQEEQGRLVKMGALPESGTRTVGQGVGQTRVVGPGPGTNGQYPTEFVSNRLRESESRDRRDAREREKEMPANHSNVGANDNPLPVDVRASRFLTKSGSTEVQIAWGHSDGAFALSEEMRGVADPRIQVGDKSLVRMWAVQYDGTHRRKRVFSREYRVDHRETDPRRQDVYTLSVKGWANPFRLRLQWNQTIGASKEDPSGTASPLVKRSVRQLGPRSPLGQADGAALLMSDLMPTQFEQGEAPVRENLSPYPFSTLDADEQISIYFELYNLALDEEGRSRYAVEYTVVRPKEDGGLFFGLFGGDGQAETRTKVTHQGDSSREEEFVQIDLSEWKDVTEGDLSISVQVTDKVTGKKAQRSIAFTTAD